MCKDASPGKKHAHPALLSQAAESVKKPQFLRKKTAATQNQTASEPHIAAT